MPKFEQFDIENTPTNRFHPKCNIQCFAYSIIVGISCFFIPFFIFLSRTNEKSYNYEFQISPTNGTIFLQSFEERLQNIIKIEKTTATFYTQYSWRPKTRNYNMEDAMIKYRIWDNGKNDLTLKLKDLFRENIESNIIKTSAKYKNIKKKIELNIHWRINKNIYNTFSWQQSAKINNVNKPTINNLEDVKNYFTNADIFFKDGEWINYNKKSVEMITYISNINGKNIEFDLLIEENSISLEYKWKDKLSYQDTKIIQEIGEKLIS